MAAAKPEVLVTQKPTEISVKFQRLEPGFRGRPTHLSYCSLIQCWQTDTELAVGILKLSLSAEKLWLLPVWRSPFLYPVLVNIPRCQQWHIWSWRPQNHGYSRWNFADIPLQTRVTTICGKIPNVLPTSGRHIGSQGEVGVKILHHFVAQPYLGKVTKAFG